MTNLITPDARVWKSWQKNAFRFFFIFLGITSLSGYNILQPIISLDTQNWSKLLSGFSKPIYWLDHHFYHFGYDPKTDSTFMSDGRFGWAYLLTSFLISVIGSIVWALADKNRKNYNRLHFWFRTYLAYYLYIAMVIYAVEKIIPVQMPFPNVDTLQAPIGQQSGFGMVWNFIGSNPAYSIFTGCCELAASLLILFRRTRVFGCLFMTTVLANVVCLNVFYNIIVKMLCIQLLLTTLFLLAPYIPKLFHFFYELKPVSLAEPAYVFNTSWKKWIMILLLLAPLWVSYGIIKKSRGMYLRDAINRKNQRLYDVHLFLKGPDTLAPLLTDTLRWKRFAITAYRENKMAIIYNMKGEGDYYDYDQDSIKKTITLHDNPDTSTWHVLHYSYPGPNEYQLTGIWKNHPFSARMQTLDIDSMFILTRDKIKWVQDF